MKCVGGNKNSKSGPLTAVVVSVDRTQRCTPGYCLRVCLWSPPTHTCSSYTVASIRKCVNLKKKQQKNLEYFLIYCPTCLKVKTSKMKDKNSPQKSLRGAWRLQAVLFARGNVPFPFMRGTTSLSLQRLSGLFAFRRLLRLRGVQYFVLDWGEKEDALLFVCPRSS